MSNNSTTNSIPSTNSTTEIDTSVLKINSISVNGCYSAKAPIGVSISGTYENTISNLNNFKTLNSIATEYRSNLASLIMFMTEKEIDSMLDPILARLNDEGDKLNFRDAVVEIVRSRHFSEEFLVKYFEYFSKYDAFVHHSAEIQSGEYSRICLYYELVK